MSRWRLRVGVALVAAALAVPGTAQAGERVRVAPTPPMGWSSWSSLRGNISAAAIEAQAKVMHDKLASHGYQYVNIDAGWSDHVDQYGRNVWNTTKFPNGIAAVAGHVHGLGLKFGIYLVPGIPKAAVAANSSIKGTPYHVSDIIDPKLPGNTASDGSAHLDYSKPGATEYVRSQADLLASWGVDYVKMDFVGPGGGRVVTDNRADIQHWRQALDATGRPISLELSNSLSFSNAGVWASYANGWRIEGDIECYSHCPGLTNWAMRVSLRFKDAPKWVPFAGPGHWNDLDSVEVGNGGADGITPDERQSMLTLWSISAAPLLLGTDLTKLDPADLTLLTNDEVIAVDQAGHAAHPVSQAQPQQVWFSDNKDGSYTLALFNLGDTTAAVTANWTDLGVHRGTATVRDLWSRRDLGAKNTGITTTLTPHASQLLRVRF